MAEPDFIPDSEFVPDKPSPQPAPSGAAPDFIPDDQFTPDAEGPPPTDPKYNTPGQGLLGAGEALAKGFAGPVATLAEKGLSKLGVPGLSPEDQRRRAQALEESNPLFSAVAGPAGFAAGMFTGASEAGVIGKLGEAGQALMGLGQVAKDAALGTKLAAGAARAGTEIAGIQAGDEISKAVNGESKGVGSAIANVGLAGVLGAAGGGLFAGAVKATKGALDAIGLKEMVDQLGVRAVDPNPAEALIEEYSNAHKTIRQMGSDVGGINGVGAAARDNLMPDLHPGMQGQAQELLNKVNGTIGALQKNGDRSGAVSLMQAQADKIEAALNPNLDPLGINGMEAKTPVSAGNIYDTLNGVKRQLGEWGQFNKEMVPLAEQPFRNAAKGLGSSFKEALEDNGVWGPVGDLQKSLNSAWTKVIPGMKDAEKQFMQKVGGEYISDPAKFATYLNQNGKLTTQSIRQARMGGFIKGAEEFQSAVADAYEKAGLENPYPVAGLGRLKASIGVESQGAKIANTLYDKVTPQALGDMSGMALGQAIVPGIGGIYAGKWGLGRLMTTFIKPVAEKAQSMGGWRAALSYVRDVAEGDAKKTNTIFNLFKAGAKTLPTENMPDIKHLLKLDDHLKKLQTDQSSMIHVPGQLPHYMPDHAEKLASTTMNAVNVLNAQRPSATKPSPLDSEIQPSKGDMAAYHRKLAIAEQPLMVLHHIGEGTLLPSDVGTLKSLYPEYYQEMSTHIMTAMSDHLQNEGTIPYTVRQGLSMFLAQPLDSTMTPSSIQAIQNVFASQGPQPQQQGAPKGKGAASKLGQGVATMRTPDQARQDRSNKA